MSIASQITTMQEHIEDIYDTFAVAGVDTSAAAKNIVNINANLKERLEYYLANGLDVVWNNWNKVSGSGTTLSLNNTIQAKMDFVYKGNTSQSILPSGYTQVDYITSDGNSYIDTGKALGDNFKIETKFIHNQQSSNEQPIISTWVNSYAWFNLYIASNNQLRFYAAGNHMTANPTLTIGNINTVSYSRNSNEWVGTLNGEEVTFTTELTSSNPTTFKILARGDGTKGSYVSIYRLKLFENNILTMDLIPCYRNSDNVIGMYDIVNNIFYTNSGTGNFTYGSVAPTPECPIPVNVVTGDNEVKVEGKNLAYTGWSEDFVTRINDVNKAKIETYDNKNCLYFSANAGYQEYDTKYIFKTNWKENTQYTFKFKLYTPGTDTNISIQYIDGTSSYFGTHTANIWTDITYSSTSGKTIKYLRVSYNDRWSRIDLDTFMVYEGTDNADYVPYQSQTYPINLGTKNLIDLINFIPVNSNTIVSLLENGINVNNVSEDGYGAKIQLTDLKANTDYYVSYNWKNISNGTNRVVVFAGTGTSTRLALFSNLNGGTFNTGDNTTINIWFYAKTPGIAEVEYTNIQLEEGTIKHNYTPSWFTPIELCKIGDYQDYIAKSTGKNILDNNNYLQGTFSPSTGGNDNVTSTTTTKVSTKLIEIDNTKSNLVYTGSYFELIAFYTSDLSYISYTSSNPSTIPNNAKYCRIRLNNSNQELLLSTVKAENTMFEYGSTATTYEPYGKVWYKYGAIGKVVLDGSEDWRKSGDARNISYYYASSNDINYKFNGIKTNIMETTGGSSVYPAYSTYFKFIANETLFSDIQGAIFDKISNIIELRFGFGLSTSISTLELFKQWLSDNNVTVYFPLATPTTTEITDTTLLSQLEAIKLSYNEQTNISQTNADKPFILDVTALKDLDAEDTTPALTTNRGLLFTQPPVSENFINDEDDNSILEETINEEEPNIEDDNREEEEPVDFFEKEIINNDEEQEEIPTEPIEIDNGQR